jgi:hypothetical protein
LQTVGELCSKSAPLQLYHSNCPQDLYPSASPHTRVTGNLFRMATVRSNVKQGGTSFSVWETIIEQAFAQVVTELSPLTSSPEFTNHYSKFPHSYGTHDSYHKSIPVPRRAESRRGSLSSYASSVSSGNLIFPALITAIHSSK